MPFIPIPEDERQRDYPKPCMSPEHSPPSMMVLMAGPHRWQCPVCGETTTIYGSDVYCGAR